MSCEYSSTLRGIEQVRWRLAALRSLATHFIRTFALTALKRRNDVNGTRTLSQVALNHAEIYLRCGSRLLTPAPELWEIFALWGKFRMSEGSCGAQN